MAVAAVAAAAIVVAVVGQRLMNYLSKAKITTHLCLPEANGELKKMESAVSKRKSTAAMHQLLRLLQQMSPLSDMCPAPITVIFAPFSLTNLHVHYCYWFTSLGQHTSGRTNAGIRS